MSVHNFNLFSDDDVSKHWEEGKDGRHGRLSVDDEKWDMVDLEAIGEVMDSCPSGVCMGDYDDLMSSVNQLCGELIYVTFDTPCSVQSWPSSALKVDVPGCGKKKSLTIAILYGISQGLQERDSL